MSTSYSKLAYLAYKKEATPGVALYPDTLVEIIEESIKFPWETSPVSTIAGRRSKNIRNVLMPVAAPNGDITLYAEPKRIGDWLTSQLGEAVDSTLSAGESYQHDFALRSAGKSYTIDIAVAGLNYVRRLMGAYVESLEFSIDDNKLQAKPTIKALACFSNARVKTAVGSGTTLVLDQTYGLTTSDSIIIIDKNDESTELATLTIASIDSATQLTVSTIGVSLEVDDIVVIKRNASLQANQSPELIFAGGAKAYFYTGANAMQNLAAKSNLEEFSLTLKGELEERHSARGCNVADRMPYAILGKGFEVEGMFKQYHVNPQMIDILRSNSQVGLRVDFCGAQLDTNSAVAATGVLESTGAGTVTVTADSAGEASNDYAILVVQGTSTLSASISGKLITVTLDADAADNAVALVASVIDALSGVSATSASTGNVSTTDNPNKVHFSGGRDANEIELLRFDFPDIRFDPFDPSLSDDAILEEEINFKAYVDANDDVEVAIRLRNAVADY